MSMNQSFHSLFENSNVSTQKLITLIAIMQTDSLFFDFVYEVFREKLVIGFDELTDRDISVFFKDKQLQSDTVAKWTDYTLKRLGAYYKTVLTEAGVLSRGTGTRRILKPIMDQALEDCLRNNGMELVIHALTGVR